MRCRLALCALAMLAASFGAPTAALAAILVTVDKSSQQMTVEVDGERRFTWPVSTGKSGYATPSGAWTTFRMEEDHFSQEWDDAPMPHSIFFTKDGHAIHGSFETKRLGQPASHGCVRLAPANAAALFALVRKQGLANTRVVLTGNEEVAIARHKAIAEAAAARRKEELARRKAELASRDTSKREESAPTKTTATKAATKAAARDKRVGTKTARQSVRPSAGYARYDGRPAAYVDPYNGEVRYLRRYGEPRYYGGGYYADEW